MTMLIHRFFTNRFGRKAQSAPDAAAGPSKLSFFGRRALQAAYRNNATPIPMPGPAYMSALGKFQGYPMNLTQGGDGKLGVQVTAFFRAHEPQTANQTNVPITSGGSGIIAGQLYQYPLIDTSNGSQVS